MQKGPIPRERDRAKYEAAGVTFRPIVEGAETPRRQMTNFPAMRWFSLALERSELIDEFRVTDQRHFMPGIRMLRQLCPYRSYCSSRQ
jgi:hypothetical protein